MNWQACEHDTEWPFELFATDFQMDPEKTALLVVDMQGSDLKINANDDLGQKYPQIVTYWNQRMEEIVVPNISRLLDAFRPAGRRVVYTRNGKITPHGAELTARLRRHKPKADAPLRYRGTPSYDIMTALATQEDQLIVDKLTSGAFHSTILDHALRNMNVRDVVIVGIATDMCVFGTARVAAELGYNALLCEDACATYTQRAHEDALLMHARVFGRVATTQDVLDELDTATSLKS